MSLQDIEQAGRIWPEGFSVADYARLLGISRAAARRELERAYQRAHVGKRAHGSRGVRYYR